MSYLAFSGAAVSGLMLLASCSSAPAPEPEPPLAPVETAKPVATTEPAPPSGPRQIMRRDCEALAAKYGELVVSDEATKLSPKLTPAQRDTGMANIKKGAQTLSERFAEGCGQSLVGGFTDEASLQCAMRGKTLTEFDLCMNGPVPGASSAP